MDIATLVGIVGGIGLFYWALTDGGAIKDFINVPSVVITFGGTFAATLINYPFRTLFGLVRVVRNAFVARSPDPRQTIETLVAFAERARREGLLALEDAINELGDPYLRKGLQLVVDGTDPELVRSIMETELAFLEERHKSGAQVFDTIGLLAPAFGMIGTLIGLIAMLKSLDDPSKIGPGMAVALLTTFYGAMLANFVCIPIAGKLRVKSAEEVLDKEVMLEGVLSIQSGDSPRIVEEKLKSFLPPDLREKAAKEADAAAGGAPVGEEA